jgi:hypothetical protein
MLLIVSRFVKPEFMVEGSRCGGSALRSAAQAAALTFAAVGLFGLRTEKCLLAGGAADD